MFWVFDVGDLYVDDYVVELVYWLEIDIVLKNGMKGEWWVYFGFEWFEVVDEYVVMNWYDVVDDYGCCLLIMLKYGCLIGDIIYKWVGKLMCFCEYGDCLYDCE